MNEKKLMPEGSYISDFQIKTNQKTLLAAYQTGSAEQDNSMLLMLQHDYIGCDSELGREQLSEMLAAASNAEILPQSIVLHDKAVLLACPGNDALGSLCRMEAMGTSIFVCRRAAERYASATELCCGEKAEETEIWSLLTRAQKIISF